MRCRGHRCQGNPAAPSEPARPAEARYPTAPPSVSRLVITEGAIIGLACSLAGAALGLAAAAQFAGQLPATLYLIAAAAVVGGLLVTTTAALLPAQALRRLPAAYLLAEE